MDMIGVLIVFIKGDPFSPRIIMSPNPPPDDIPKRVAVVYFQYGNLLDADPVEELRVRKSLSRKWAFAGTILLVAGFALQLFATFWEILC